MIRRVSVAVLMFTLCSAAFAQDDAAKQKAAQQAAHSWLVQVDRGGYGESWQQAASFFKSKVSKSDWEKALQQVRAPLGAASKRTLMGSVYQTELPNVPKGEYVIIQYKTKFAGVGTAIETVTPTLDKDGKWRVSGYFVAPAK